MTEKECHEFAIFFGDGRLETPRIYKGVILPLPRIIVTLRQNSKHYSAENAANCKKVN